MIIEWSLNGRPLRSEVSPFKRLLDYLRTDLKLLGAKEGCQIGKCGACTIWINGEVANACLVLMGQMEGREVTTIEGINEKDRFTPLQESFLTASAIECGFCIPGMVMSGTKLLSEVQTPSRLEIRQALKGHLCACTGYQKILDAIEGVGLPPASEGANRMRVRR
jgi:carbon-monoxide dehydrogenase small subunit